VNGNPSSKSGGFTLATLHLGDEADVVSLRRRVRATGEEFGLPERDIRRISASVYEVGRRLCASGIVADADLGLGDGPSLRVVFHIRQTNGSAGPAQFASVLEPLRMMLDELTIAVSPTGITIGLALPFQPDARRRLPEADPVAPVQEPTGTVEEPDPESVGERYRTLRRAYRELQGELQETNRGVVALYAEHDDHADRLRQAEDRLRLLLDSVQDYAICMLSREGEVTSWNAGAERLFGYASDEIIGRSFATFYTVADQAAGMDAAHLASAEDDGRIESEGARVRRGGALFDAHLILTPVRGAASDLRGFSLVVRDITERKRLEEDLRRRAEDLAAANRAKEDFLATLSHELRTPLNAMLGWTRLLRSGRLDAAGATRALETIERNAHLQEQLIADILDVSRIVTGKLRLELRPIELWPVVEAALDAVRPAAEAKGVTLRSRSEFADTVLGDPDRLQQVIWNLVVNAIKFTPGGGHVDVSLDRVGTSAVIVVADTGEGMESDLLPFIFDRFRQGDTSVTRPHGGLGLGLSIVRHIVELHGGKVQVHSDGLGRGSTFSVQLPVRAIRRAPEPPASGARPLEGLKILIVDDEPDAREVVSLALEQFGASPTSAGSVREALQALAEIHPDILVSDIRMPGEDGYTLIRRVRGLASSAERQLPAIALTGLSHADDRRRALVEGYQRFVVKPVEVDELAATIRQLVPRRTRG
jgi:PAS domain S-box-containing protein